MKLDLDRRASISYNSFSQKARVLTETWVDKEIYCPNCGFEELTKYSNNRPVADFVCKRCQEDFELKSKKTAIGEKIVDGAYRTMLDRLASLNNPNLFLLRYDATALRVSEFFVIPKHFLVPAAIEKRKPLSPAARRAGWVGCNILLSRIPSSGRIFLIKDDQAVNKKTVLRDWKKTLFLREEKETLARGWLLDVMTCVEAIGKPVFTTADIYQYEGRLARLHPDNKHVKDKIRQQLQRLRDKGYLEFYGKGRYRLAL